MLLIKKATDIMDLSQSRIDEIKAMALYISIFHVPKFLSAEKSLFLPKVSDYLYFTLWKLVLLD